MVETPILDLQQKQSGNMQQLQRLMMLPGMQQAIHLLQMPVMELAPLVEEQLAQNPIIQIDEDASEDDDIARLEEENEEEKEELDTLPEEEMTFDERDFDIIKRLDKDFRDQCTEESPYKSRNSEEDRQQSFAEQSICAQPTLFEYLMTQAHDAFDKPEELAAAEILIGSLDEYGYLHTPLQEIAALHNFSESTLRDILSVIQTFDPQGIGATSLQESLLIQLRYRGKENSLASKIIAQHYDDLLHNRIPVIQRSLHCSQEDITHAIHHDIAHLDLRPGTSYSAQSTQPLIPDVTIRQEGDELLVGVNNDFLPPLRINGRYLKLIREAQLAPDTKQFIQHHIASAKWLLKNIMQRNDTLQNIVEILVKRQRKFFTEPDGKLVPMTMKVVSEELEIHESTVARAVANKTVDTPRGLLPLRSFFSNAYTTEEGVEISSKTVRELVHELIQKEDRSHPLSDLALSESLKEKGIVCARRTVAKYRTELNLGNAQQRRKY